VTANDIRRTVERHAHDPDAAARALVDAANRAGGKDNVTVLVIEGEQFAGPAFEERKTKRAIGAAALRCFCTAC